MKQNGKIKRIRKTSDQKRIEQLKCRLTEELFDIALGQNRAGDSGGEPVGIKERLKAAELLAKYSESGEQRPEGTAAAVIIDDIGD